MWLRRPSCWNSKELERKSNFKGQEGRLFRARLNADLRALKEGGVGVWRCLRRGRGGSICSIAKKGRELGGCSVKWNGREVGVPPRHSCELWNWSVGVRWWPAPNADSLWCREVGGFVEVTL